MVVQLIILTDYAQVHVRVAVCAAGTTAEPPNYEINAFRTFCLGSSQL